MVFDNEITAYKNCYRHLDISQVDAVISDLEASLKDFESFKGKTVVVVAHRLSTVKNADKIVVLDNGEITEEGTHIELTLKRGKYYELVKNQLELGN